MRATLTALLKTAGVASSPQHTDAGSDSGVHFRPIMPPPSPKAGAASSAVSSPASLRLRTMASFDGSDATAAGAAATAALVAAVKQHADVVFGALDALTSLAGDLLDLRRVAARAPVLDVSRRLELRALMAFSKAYLAAAAAPGTRLGYRITPDTATVQVDGKRLLQAIANGVR